jgi:hypothetical protein
MKTKEELKLEYGAPRKEAFGTLDEYLEAKELWIRDHIEWYTQIILANQ